MTFSGNESDQELLRLAIASHYSEPAKQRWSELAAQSELNWSNIAQLATLHGLGPLLYEATSAIPAAHPPDEIWTDLKRQYQLTATLNMLAMHDLQQILRCLNGQNIPAILLKGASLLNNVYDNQALRPMIDLDLLLPFADLPLARHALAEIGYTNTEPLPFYNLDGLYWNEVLLHDSSRTSAQLEVHWNLFDIPYYASRLPVSALAQRAVTVTAEGQPALLLSPEDLLLHLCAHNLYHHQGKLWRTEVDIAFVIHRFGASMDWGRIISTATSNDLLLALKCTLTGAAEHWFSPVPQAALDQLGELQPRFRERFFTWCQRSEFLKLFRTFVTLPGAYHRWNFVKGQLLPSREYLSWRYETPFSTPAPLAYARRYLSGLTGLVSELAGRSKPK